MPDDHHLHAVPGDASNKSHLAGTDANKLPLCQQRMQLHLVDDRLDASSFQQVLNLLYAEVGDSNVFYKAIVNQGLHGFPAQGASAFSIIIIIHVLC